MNNLTSDQSDLFKNAAACLFAEATQPRDRDVLHAVGLVSEFDNDQWEQFLTAIRHQFRNIARDADVREWIAYYNKLTVALNDMLKIVENRPGN